MYPKTTSQDGHPCGHVPSGSTLHPSTAGQTPSSTQREKEASPGNRFPRNNALGYLALYSSKVASGLRRSMPRSLLHTYRFTVPTVRLLSLPSRGGVVPTVITPAEPGRSATGASPPIAANTAPAASTAFSFMLRSSLWAVPKVLVPDTGSSLAGRFQPLPRATGRGGRRWPKFSPHSQYVPPRAPRTLTRPRSFMTWARARRLMLRNRRLRSRASTSCTLGSSLSFRRNQAQSAFMVHLRSFGGPTRSRTWSPPTSRTSRVSGSRRWPTSPGPPR